MTNNYERSWWDWLDELLSKVIFDWEEERKREAKVTMKYAILDSRVSGHESFRSHVNSISKSRLDKTWETEQKMEKNAERREERDRKVETGGREEWEVKNERVMMIKFEESGQMYRERRERKCTDQETSVEGE